MKFLQAGFWQKLVMGLLLLLEIVAFVAGVILLATFWTDAGDQATFYLVIIVFVADVVTEMYIINTRVPYIYKITWMFFVSALPILGLLFYLFFANKQTSRLQRKKYVRWSSTLQKDPTTPETKAALLASCPDAAGIANYIQYASGGGIYSGSEVSYFSLGDEAFPAILRELKKAKHYIFLEFFIIDKGLFWDSILEILKQKVKEGVDVRLMYDDLGCLGTTPFRYYKKLQKMGIKAQAFSPFRPLIDIRMNNRDHRKIMVIDGHTCFTGGINLADEYINKIVRFGHWKDNAIMIKGEAVYGFTMLFLSNWNANFDPGAKIENIAYRPSVYLPETGETIRNDGFVQPYGDLPFDKEATGERVYLSIIQKAHKYIYISTPYLLIDEQMEDALTNAAKEGIDVRLLTPRIPDKKTVFNITRSYYGNLIKAGVKVYEYTPGFVHEKMFVSDDVIATVGTINLDYRSLYLHLECGTFMVGCSSIMNMKQDFIDSFALSHQVSREEWEKWHVRQKSYWAILRILAPLL